MTSASGASGAASASAEGVRLEMLPPLSRGMELLSPEKAPDFDIDAFLSSRTRGQDVDVIFSELRAYKASLREELVAAVNDEYRDFVAIASAMHQDADKIKALDAGDIGRARQEIKQLKTRLSTHATEIRDCIAADEREYREEHVLSTMQEIDDVLQQISVDVGLTPHPPLPTLDLSAFSGEHDAPEAPICVKVSLGRALDRYRWFLDLCSSVGDDAPFLNAQATRILRVRECFTQEAFRKLELALDANDYENIELALSCAAVLPQSVDEMLTRIRSHVVQPWLAAHVQNGRLEDADAPADKERIDEQIYQADDVARQVTGLPLPDTPLTPSARGLIRVYNGCLSLAATARPISAAGARAQVDVFGAIWHDVAMRLMDTYGAQLFFVGHADAFHQHYTATRLFLGAWSELAPSEAARRAFYAHQTTRIFERRWQLSAYLHLRMRETVVSLEESLSSNSPTHGFMNGALTHLLQAFVRPWLASQHVASLRAREWHFSLQVASRYHKWALDIAQHESDLATLAALPSDAREFETRVERTLSEVIMPRLSADETLHETLSCAIREAFVAQELGERVERKIVQALQQECAEPLRHIRGTAQQYRGTREASESKTASAFIPQLLEPLRKLLGQLDEQTRPHARSWAQAVVDDIVSRYAQALGTITQNLESLRRLKRGTGLDASSLPGAGIYAQMRTDVEALKQELLELSSAYSLSLDTSAVSRLERIANDQV